LEDCYKGRFLRKTDPDLNMSKKAIEMANEKLNRALELHDKGFFDESVVASYAAMFQSA